MKIIGISGKKGSGKTATASEIVRTFRYDLQGKHGFFYKLAFADEIKRIAIEVMGVPKEVAFGTDEQKSSTYTKYEWKKMPFYAGLPEPKPSGYMTVRHIFQTLGTEIFRSMDPDIWLNAMGRKIEQLPGDHNYMGPKTIIIDDARFDNEIEFIRKRGGRMYYLTRRLGESKDTHATEKDLNPSLFDMVIDNTKMTIEETAQLIIKDSELGKLAN